MDFGFHLLLPAWRMYEHFSLFKEVKVPSCIEIEFMMYMYFNFSHYHFLYFEEKKIVICLFEGCYIDLILNDLDLYTDR